MAGGGLRRDGRRSGRQTGRRIGRRRAFLAEPARLELGQEHLEGLAEHSTQIAVRELVTHQGLRPQELVA